MAAVYEPARVGNQIPITGETIPNYFLLCNALALAQDIYLKSGLEVLSVQSLNQHNICWGWSD